MVRLAARAGDEVQRRGVALARIGAGDGLVEFLGENFAAFDAPLVERVDAPQDAGGEGAVLGK
mgnify:CR=1 FL=1